MRNRSTYECDLTQAKSRYSATMNDGGSVRFASIPPRKMLRDVRMAAMKGRIWMNAINVEADHGTIERALYKEFYGENHGWDTAGWREMAAFSSCVLRPLEWAGLLVQTAEEREGKQLHHVFKTPLWRSALNLDTDGMLRPVLVQ